MDMVWVSGVLPVILRGGRGGGRAGGLVATGSGSGRPFCWEGAATFLPLNEGDAIAFSNPFRLFQGTSPLVSLA